MDNYLVCSSNPFILIFTCAKSFHLCSYYMWYMYVSLHVDYRVCKEKLQHSASLSSLTGVNKMLHNASLLHKLKDFSKHQLLGQHALKYYSLSTVNIYFCKNSKCDVNFLFLFPRTYEKQNGVIKIWSARQVCVFLSFPHHAPLLQYCFTNHSF